METSPPCLIFLLLTAGTVLIVHCDNEDVSPEKYKFDTGGLSRESFPKGFIFGKATSACQVEGAASTEGRGPSIWDTFIKQPGVEPNNANGEVSVDQYHQYKDVYLMAKLNFEAYRFSISWSRIFPNGAGKVNWKGVAYYNRLFDYMLKRGITPYANINHYDLSQALQDRYNGWLGRTKDFAYYAEFCFKTFGDRVKNWFSFNEPTVVAALGCSKPYIVAHNLILCHASAAQRYRKKYQPKTMQNIVGTRLPKFTEEEVKMVKGLFDYVGINQYTAYYMYDPHYTTPQPLGYQQDWNAGFAYDLNGVPIGPRAHSYWLYVVPWGLYKAINYVKEHYGNPTMILAENGMDYAGNITLPKALHDTKRIDYYRSCLQELKKTVYEGANVIGYFAWSLLDNFEWRLGYTSRFGIVYIDFNTLEQYPKISAHWFRKLLRRQKH
ncbi:unnamed protein product [Withania somnifera]